MKKIFITFIFLFAGIFTTLADPGCKLGEYLSTVQSEVSGLRHLRDWPSQGDEYIVYHETGVSTSYYFKNNRCIKEQFTINTNKQNANYYFDRFVSDFSNQNYINAYEGSNSVTFIFSYIQVKVSIEYFSGSSYLVKVTYTYR